MSEIAITVLGVVERPAGDEYLLQRLVDPAGEAFYRPIGGGVEFGETSRAALLRGEAGEGRGHLTAPDGGA